jgi:hypothetical protein
MLVIWSIFLLTTTILSSSKLNYERRQKFHQNYRISHKVRIVLFYYLFLVIASNGRIWCEGISHQSTSNITNLLCK